MNDLRICPSILNADLENLSHEIERVATADLLHLDIMDNIFVPNITFDFAQSREIIEQSPIPVDTHLMIVDPDIRAIDYAHARSASVTFHFEASTQPEETLKAIRAAGSRAGLAIKPQTPFWSIADLLPSLDMLLIMTVEPGFGGQKFMADQMPKLQQAADAIAQMRAPHPWLQVDGGITLETIRIAAQCGADTFVAGSAIYRSESPEQTIRLLRQNAQVQ